MPRWRSRKDGSRFALFHIPIVLNEEEWEQVIYIAAANSMNPRDWLEAYIADLQTHIPQECKYIKSQENTP